MNASDLAGVRMWHPVIHGDERGNLVEIYRRSLLGDGVVQANHSRSRPGTLRGLHYHVRQGDLWYLVRGRIQVGLADLREPASSPRTETFLLDETEPSVLYIPPMVAHGYLALTEVDIVYFFTSEYARDDEFGIVWNDPTLALPWRNENPVVSERDRANPPLRWNDLPRSS